MLKLNLQIEQFERALRKLDEALALEETEIVRDGTIQRFEFCFEIAWKLLKSINKKEGLETQSPRQAIKTAFKLKIIHDEDVWLDSIEFRNLVSHTYSEEVAETIYKSIPEFLAKFKELLVFVKQ